MRAYVIRALCLSGIVAICLSSPVTTANNHERESPINEQYHYTFETWTASVVRLTISTLPGSDVKVHELLSVRRCSPSQAFDEGVFVHFTAGIRNDDWSDYSFLQWYTGDDPLLTGRIGDTTIRSPGVDTSEGCRGGILSDATADFYDGGVYERYWTTQGGSGRLVLNLTGTTGLIDKKIEVLDGARFLRQVDFDGLAFQANALYTNLGASARQTATVPVDGPSFGHSTYAALSKAGCTSPDGNDCHNKVVMAQGSGNWKFTIDYMIGIDSPMWYMGAVFPR